MENKLANTLLSELIHLNGPERTYELIVKLFLQGDISLEDKDNLLSDFIITVR